MFDEIYKTYGLSIGDQRLQSKWEKMYVKSYELVGKVIKYQIAIVISSGGVGGV